MKMNDMKTIFKYLRRVLYIKDVFPLDFRFLEFNSNQRYALIGDRLTYTMRTFKSFQAYFFLHCEWIMLSGALLAMAFLNPYENSQTLCLFEIAGVPFCPGEGFGRSIALLVRGEWVLSFQMHPLGIPGTMIILHRIYSIINRNQSIKLP